MLEGKNGTNNGTIDSYFKQCFGAGDQLRSAPAPSGAFAELQFFFSNRGRSLMELAKMVSSAPAELLVLKNISLLLNTRALVSL